MALQVLKKITGAILLVIGVAALLTPFTPGSWLIFVGLELLGIRILFAERIRNWFRRWKR